MDIWTKLTEFFTCGLIVLPLVLGFSMHSFEAFAVTLGLMQVALIAVVSGAPTVPQDNQDNDEEGRRKR